jgi:hypothetical protein
MILRDVIIGGGGYGRILMHTKKKKHSNMEI